MLRWTELLGHSLGALRLFLGIVGHDSTSVAASRALFVRGVIQICFSTLGRSMAERGELTVLQGTSIRASIARIEELLVGRRLQKLILINLPR